MDVPFLMCALIVANLFVYALSSNHFACTGHTSAYMLNALAALRLFSCLQALRCFTWFLCARSTTALSVTVCIGRHVRSSVSCCVALDLLIAWANFRESLTAQEARI